MKTLGEINWNGIFGYINEVIVDADDLKVVRYFSDKMVSNENTLMMNPVIKLEKKKNGWKAYFLDAKYEDFDYPIFEKNGVDCTFFIN